MRVRERTPQVLMEAPPAELRMFWNPSPGYPGPGMEAFGDRETWLAARAAWAAKHGMTVREWWDGFVDELQEHAQTLAEINLPFSREYFVEEDDEDDEDDPRQRPFGAPAAGD